MKNCQSSCNFPSSQNEASSRERETDMTTISMAQGKCGESGEKKKGLISFPTLCGGWSCWVCQITQTPGWHGWVRELAHNEGDVPKSLPVSVAGLNQARREKLVNELLSRQMWACECLCACLCRAHKWFWITALILLNRTQTWRALMHKHRFHSVCGYGPVALHLPPMTHFLLDVPLHTSWMRECAFKKAIKHATMWFYELLGNC